MSEPDLHDPEWLIAANAHAREKGCPSCKSPDVSVSWKYWPTGGLLSGSTIKFSCVNILIFECGSCGIKAHLTEDDE